MASQPGFFDVDERYAAVSAAGDPLEHLGGVVDLELFRPVLDAALARSERSRGGRPPYDAALTFRVLVRQALYSLSDAQAEFQLRDRLSFLRFVGLGLHEVVPDAKTSWLPRAGPPLDGDQRRAARDAAQHGSRSFADLLDAGNTADRVWADTAYRTKRNLEVLEQRGLTERLQFRRPPRRAI